MKLFSKYVLYATSISVVLYGLALLYHVHRAEDLGVDCLFSNERPSGGVGIEPAPQIGWVDRQMQAIGPRPQPGDRLVAVGGRHVPTFLHFKRAVAALARPAEWDDRNVLMAETTAALLGAADETTAALIGVADKSTAALIEGADEPALAQVGVDRWVRVEFITSTSRGSALVSSAWLQLKPLPNQLLMLSIAWLLLETIILTIGAIAVRKLPGDRSASMFFALSAVHVVTFMGAFHWSDLVGTRVLVYPFVFCTILLAPITLHFYLLLPRPRRLIQHWPRITLAAIYAMPVAWMVFIFVCLSLSHRLYEQSAQPAELTRWLELLSASIYGYLVVAVAMFAVGWAVLIHGYANARTTAQRNQIRWVLAAVVVATSLTGYLLYLATIDRAAFAFATSTRLTLYLTSVMFTLAYAVSITRYKLMQVGRLVNRGMLYVIISLGATALYCLMVGAGTALLGKYYFRWENALAAGLAAMLVVVVLGWMSDRFQRSLDRRFIREKYQLNKAMRRLSDAVDQLVEPATLARQFLRSVADAVGAQQGVIYLRDPARACFVPVAQSGWPASDDQLASESPLVAELHAEGVLSSRGAIGVLPSAGKFQLRELGAEVGVALELDGDVVGLAILGPKEEATPYTPEDFNFLFALARTTALALRSARERRTIEAQQVRMQSQVGKISQLQQQIHLLQGELLSDGAAASSPSETAGSAPEPMPELKHQIRGKSAAVRHMLAQAARIARSESSVIVRGESGTGKELLAQAIHDNSSRAAGPFVPVHCAALSSGLLESELFGHVKGAFTGADRERVGRFEMAHEGSLFLDEIGDISLETQTKLLRVLQERSFERVGGVDTIQVDVRLITATHQNLEALIRKGRFRQDLFYRLNVISIWCPPLRERRDDIFELSLFFLRRYAERSGKTIRRIEDEAIEALAACRWPGNVRQLENAIERACVLAETESIRLADLPPEVIVYRGGAASAGVALGGTARRPVGDVPDGQGSGQAGLPSSDDRVAPAAAGDDSSGTDYGVSDFGPSPFVVTGPGGGGSSDPDSGGTAGSPSSGDRVGPAAAGVDQGGTARGPVGDAPDRHGSGQAGLPSSGDRVAPAAAGDSSSGTHFGPTGSASDPYGTSKPRRRMSPGEALMAAHEIEEFDYLHEEVTALERDRLQMAMARAGGNKAQAARLLGMPRSTFFYKLKRHGLD